MSTAHATHESRVNAICSTVKGFYDRKEKFRIYHGTTNSTRRARWKRSQVVDTSDLKHLIDVDVGNRLITVEPNMPMDDLVACTLEHSLLPPVVPEFPGITVGGATVGSAGESSSYKYGLFDRTVESVEIVLANGDVVNASPNENSDLFNGIGSSFGTLGVLTQITLRLVPAKTYVEVTYHSATSFQDACQKLLDSAVDPTNDFVDGIVFTREKSIIVTAKYCDPPGAGQKVQTFTKAWDQWFYIHAERQFHHDGPPKKDIVPITDYFFRYDRGGFWVGRLAFKYFCVPFDRFSRFIVDRFMHTRVMYQALHESGLGEEHIVQDLALPRQRAAEFLEYALGSLHISPLWICPLKARPTAVMNPKPILQSSSSSTTDNDKGIARGYPEIINVGVWGQGSRNRDHFIEVNRKLETTVRDLGGIKWLYAQAFYTEDEFWEIYDRPAYDALRAKYHASALPTVYDKVKLDISAEREARANWNFVQRCKATLKNVWPVRGAYGVLKTLISSEYLLERSKDRRAAIKQD